MTAVRDRDEILRPVAVPLVQQRQLILQQDNARPHVARVCRDSLANYNIQPTGLATIQSRFVPHRAFVERSGQNGKKASESQNHSRKFKKCFDR